MKNYFTLMLTLLLSIHGSKAFAYNIAVKNADGVTIYYETLYGETELAVTYLYDNSTNVQAYSGDITIPEEVTYDNKTLKVTSIGKYAFAFCHLTSITMPKSISIIEEKAFFKVEGITSIDIPNGVRTIGNEAFDNIKTLLSVNIPNSVRSIGDGAFGGCTYLPSITIPNSVEDIGEGAFSYCQSLVSVTLPETITNIKPSTFNYCSNLTSIIIPQGVTTIGDGAFTSCGRLVSVSFSANLVSIGAGAFTNCESLKTIILPNKVRSVGNSAFYQCTNLTELTLPNSLTSIGDNAFERCNLTIITSLIEKPFDIDGKNVNTRTFSQTVFDRAKLYVPDGTIERYKNTIGWNDFSNIIEKTIVREVSIDKHELSLKVGENDTLHASVYPESSLDKTIKWSSSDEKTAKVDDSGIVTALKAGEVWIKATSVSNVAVKDSCKVLVIQPVTGLSLSQSTCELNFVGENCELSAIVEPEDASNKDVMWKSYNESVCIVNNGLVIATGYGSTIVTATTDDGGFMAYCTVTVTDNTPVKGIDAETSGYKVYNLQGIENTQLQKGINIIRFKDGTSKKVLVK